MGRWKYCIYVTLVGKPERKKSESNSEGNNVINGRWIMIKMAVASQQGREASIP
jgi:hypothetical protein